jgi:hypothetical protein
MKCCGSLWERCGACRADLGVANIATEIRSDTHGGYRHNKKRRCRGDDPSGRAAATPPLPQGDPGDESCDLHQSESDERRVQMNFDGVRRDVVARLHLLLGGPAAHEDGKCQESNDEEPFQPRMLQVFVTTDECQEQQAQCGRRTDGRHVIHHQMQMREVQ